jgi:histidine triad (HIT) family protein
MSCLFCDIVEQRIDSDKIYEDEKIIAFHDIAPQAPTHIIIIPRQHIATLNDVTSEQSALVGHMIHIASSLAKQQGLTEDGYRLVMNCNAQGGQTVFHIHLHLLGGRPMHWPPG